MNEKREYWLNRGKDGPKHEGYVCLGVGDEDYDLAEQLGIDCLIRAEVNGQISDGYDGSWPDYNYYLPEEKFNELFPEEIQEPSEESFVGPAELDTRTMTASETYSEISHSLINNILTCLQIGFENTEEVFILNGQRTTRSDRMNATRLEQEMLMLNSCLEQLKEKVWNPF